MASRIERGDSSPRVFVTAGLPPHRERVLGALAELRLSVSADHPDVAVVIESGGDPLADLRDLRQRDGSTPAIFIAVTGSERLAVDAFRAGASDYLTSPVTTAQMAEGLARVRAGVKRSEGGLVLLGESASISSLRTVIRRIAPTPCSVLISGETGTGKDVVARLLHQSSDRAGRPFVGINCSAVPETLFESELFGYERGTFTGAQAASIGRLQAADGGTVFLDEIGELGLTAQPKLLRAIDRGEIQRLGSRRLETIDVRWVAATNRDLQQAVRDGLFRADLFYRLNVYNLVVPPLRERPEDLVVLGRAFLAEVATAYGRQEAQFSESALARLLAYRWPGNVRELRNVVECSVLNSGSCTIEVEDLPAVVRGPEFTTRPHAVLERVRVVEALRASHGNKSEAAHRLNWSRMTLYRKLDRHRIDVTSECDSVTPRSPHV